MKPEIYSSGSFATDLSQIKALKKDYDNINAYHDEWVDAWRDYLKENS